jgi:hypothetical protein
VRPPEVLVDHLGERGGVKTVVDDPAGGGGRRSAFGVERGLCGVVRLFRSGDLIVCVPDVPMVGWGVAWVWGVG